MLGVRPERGHKMPRVGDVALVLWVLYATFMTIASWFGPAVSSFEDWMLSIVAWLFMLVIGFAIRGND